MIHRSLQLWVAVGLLIGGVGCAQNDAHTPEPVRTLASMVSISDITISPFTTDPCAPPCWQNIAPGITTVSEAQEILFDELDLDAACIYDADYKEDFADYTNHEIPVFAIQCSDLVIMAKDDGIVAELWLWPTEQITAAQIIEVFGEPDLVYSSDDMGVDYGEMTEARFSIPYPQLGIMLNFARPGTEYLLEPDVRLSDMQYWSPASDVQLSYCIGSVSCHENKWVGYGEYLPYDK
jgi:hypothetical protein